MQRVCSQCRLGPVVGVKTARRKVTSSIRVLRALPILMGQTPSLEKSPLLFLACAAVTANEKPTGGLAMRQCLRARAVLLPTEYLCTRFSVKYVF